MTFSALGQDKIGLALSGGGAKGMAHIGVLRALEEQNIQVDYISGTSMGAVVGALYAMGYSVDDIEAYLKRVDWEAVLSNDLPRDRLGFLDRSSEEKYLLSFKLTEESIELPNAFNYGYNMLKEMDYLTQSSHAQMDFSQFPIPFFCVATDLETGEGRIFESGSLSDALRASVSFPSIFSPYEVNGRLYVDGGVANNLPIDALKERGVTTVIAVDVQATLYSKEELTSIDKVLEQVGSFQNNNSYQAQVLNADILIKPDITAFGIDDYAYTDSLISLGYSETQKFSEELSALSSPDFSPVANKKALPREEVYVQQIEVEGAKYTSSSFIKAKLEFDKPRFYTTKQIEYNLDKLYGTQFYDVVSYQLMPLDTAFTLKVKVVERAEKALIRFGVNYNDDFRAALLTNLTLRNVIIENSKFSIDFAISENPRFQLQLMTEKGAIPSLGFAIRGRQFLGKLYQNRQVLASYTQRDFSTDLFIQSTLFDFYTLGGGIKYENIALNQSIGEFEEDGANNNFLHYYGFLNFDNLNRTFKPTRGFSLQAEGRIIAKQASTQGFFEPASVVYAQVNQAFSPIDRVGVSWSALGATTIGPDMDFPYQIFLGGAGVEYPNFSFPFLGYRMGELIGRNAVTVGGEIFVEPWKNHFFSAKANAGKMEATFENLFDSSVILDGYGISYAYMSPLGPMEIIAMTSSNHSDIYTYFSLGYWF
ncbi:MAG: patatin-like phospholipase family protein [Schleiferiaceae bacterium]